jgi:MFS family permease
MSSSNSSARGRDFRLLLAGQTATQLGTQVSGVAVPLLAVLVLHASPLGLGVVNAASTVAVLLIGLPAGAWLDRVRIRPVLIASDVARAVLLLSVPLAAVLQVLTFAQLVVVSLLAGFARVLFDVGFQSYVPAVVGQAQVLRGNSALEFARTSGQVVGPGIGGALVTITGAASAFVVDAVSFLVSAVSLLAIRTPEATRVEVVRPRLRTEVAEGVRLVLRNRMLRSIGLASALSNLQFALASAATVIFLTRVLQLSGLGVGLLVGAGAGAAMLGAACTPRLADLLGSARVVWVALLLAAPFALLGAFAQPGPLVSLVVISTLLSEVGQIVYAITSVSIRQRLCPPQLLGRVNATMRVLILGLFPAGALLGGVVGDLAGPRAVLIVSGALGLLCPVVAWTGLRGARDVEQLPPIAA